MKNVPKNQSTDDNEKAKNQQDSDNTEDAVEDDGTPVLEEEDLEENDIDEDEAEDIEWDEPKSK